MSARMLVPLGLGFGVWACGFIVVYAVQGLGCAFGWDLMTLRLLVIGLVLVTLLAALIVALKVAAWRPPDGPAAFLGSVAGLCAWFAIPAIAVTFSGVLTTSVCA